MTTTTPTPTTDTLATAALAAANARAAFAAAEAAWRAAEELAIDALLTAGIPSVELSDGTKVTLKGGLEGETLRKVDLTVLHDRLTGEVYGQITKDALNTKAFDAAIEVGLIPADVIKAAVTNPPKKPTLLITAAVKAS